MNSNNNQDKKEIEETLALIDQQIQNYQEKSDGLYTQIFESHQNLLDLQQEQKQQVLHIETVNMMSKYQIVFKKMQTSLSKCISIYHNHSHFYQLQRAFYHFKNYSSNLKSASTIQKKLIVSKVSQKFRNLFRIYQNKNDLKIFQLFYKWKLEVDFQKMGNFKNQENQAQKFQKQLYEKNILKKDLLQQIALKKSVIQGQDKNINDLIHQIEVSENQLIQNQKKDEMENKKESSEKNIEPDSVNLESDPILDQQINQLKIKIQRIQEENRNLHDKIESTNENISTYISEMSSLIDSQTM